MQSATLHLKTLEYTWAVAGAVGNDDVTFMSISGRLVAVCVQVWVGKKRLQHVFLFFFFLR